MSYIDKLTCRMCKTFKERGKLRREIKIMGDSSLWLPHQKKRSYKQWRILAILKVDKK